MRTWQELVATALLGTGQDAATGREDPATVLLDEAAQAASRRRGGAAWSPAGAAPRKPPRSAQVGPPAGVDDQPVAPSAAVARLESLLPRYGEHLPADHWLRTYDDHHLVDHWLRTAGAAGYRVPERTLATLVERVASGWTAGDALVPALGARGRWLAGRRARWGSALTRLPVDLAGPHEGSEVERTWAGGGPVERRALLERVRRHDPARGRELLATTWSRERAENRQRFLQVLADGLGRDDEAFVERALDDGDARVREQARTLLALLPGSAFCARTRARCASAVSLRRGLLGRRLLVDLPSAYDAVAVRDGPFEDVPRSISREQRRLRSTVVVTPLSHWTEMAGTDAAGVLALRVEGGEPDQARELRLAWAEATARQGDGAWAEALLRRGTEPTEGGALWDALGAERCQRLAREVLSGTSTLASTAQEWVLILCPKPWDPALAALALRWMGGRDPQRRRLRPEAGSRELGLGLPLETIPAVVGLRDRCPDGSPWQATLDHVVALMTARAAIDAELS